MKYLVLYTHNSQGEITMISTHISKKSLIHSAILEFSKNNNVPTSDVQILSCDKDTPNKGFYLKDHDEYCVCGKKGQIEIYKNTVVPEWIYGEWNNVELVTTYKWQECKY